MLAHSGRHDAVGELGAAGVVGVTQCSLGFGANVVDGPGGAGLGDGGDDSASLLVDPRVGDLEPRSHARIGDFGDHVGQRALAA